MNKNGIIYIIISVIVVSTVAMLVLAPDDDSFDQVTITVMNVNTVISGAAETATSTVSYTETHTVIIYTSAAETEVSSFSTNTEPVTASTEPVTTVYEEIYVDINTADIGSLMKINGIGEVTAAEIISYREQNGGFRNVEEIMNIYGIGEATFEHICSYIYVENPVYDVEEDIIEEFPEPENVSEPETQSEITLENAAPININTADLETLLLLPYVNEQIAQDIITLREKLNGYSHVYELLYIENLEQKQVAEMVNFVTVGQ
ncbi:MAG: helix-hairpin-helix domain-containing protein [Ruminococcus sp.]|nr:helix-hairpin-helix domain-containing protein [Ruminococcus sp.]